MDLQELENIAATCSLCDLHVGQNKPVFARGSDVSKVIICGMCPGPEENKVGIPFVGNAGQILNEILLKAFGNSNLTDVYITNLVKCFVPPGTQLKQQWMAACLPYFMVQIKLINPTIIIALGKDVSNFLLNNTLPIKDMRGKIFDYMGDIKLLSTYHPSFIVRSGGITSRYFQTVVEDFKQVYKYM